MVLIRHGVTEWSKYGKHTGRTDLPLLEEGMEEASQFGDQLVGFSDDAILCPSRIGHILRSPRQRCAQTLECVLGNDKQRQLLGLPDVEVLDDCREWDYGRMKELLRYTFDKVCRNGTSMNMAHQTTKQTPTYQANLLSRLMNVQIASYVVFVRCTKVHGRMSFFSHMAILVAF